MITLLLSATLALSPGVWAPRLPGDTLFDTVFVVSNRRRSADRFQRVATDSLWRGLYVVRVITGDRRVPELDKLAILRTDSIAIDSAEWNERLRAAAARDTSAEGAVLIFVHGFASNPAAATNQGMQVKIRGEHGGPLVLFLWPAHDMARSFRAPFSTYRGDERAAARSGPAFARALLEIVDQAPNAVLVAHSMGARVALAATVTDSAIRARLEARPLRAIGIFSPDVGARVFRDEYAPQIPAIARRAAMYGASNDYLLAAAAVVNRERRAAGITQRGLPLQGIELVDDTRGARAEPAILSFLGPRHAVRWASAALTDFFDVVVADAPPSCRVALGAADTVSDGRWRLKPGAKRISALTAGCPR